MRGLFRALVLGYGGNCKSSTFYTVQRQARARVQWLVRGRQDSKAAGEVMLNSCWSILLRFFVPLTLKAALGKRSLCCRIFLAEIMRACSCMSCRHGFEAHIHHYRTGTATSSMTIRAGGQLHSDLVQNLGRPIVQRLRYTGIMTALFMGGSQDHRLLVDHNTGKDLATLWLKREEYNTHGAVMSLIDGYATHKTF